LTARGRSDTVPSSRAISRVGDSQYSCNNNNNNNNNNVNELNRSNCGYQIHGTEREICHLLYMDDLKLIGRNEEELTNEIQMVSTLSNDIK
jgi:hypothetical protein